MILKSSKDTIVFEKGKIEEVVQGHFPEANLDFSKYKLLPGFCDSHTHLLHYGLSQVRLNLKGTKSLKDALSLTREYIKKKEKEDLIVAYDWDESNWKEKRFPDKEELDRISHENPLILRRICGHIAVANSIALKKVAGERGVDTRTGIMQEDVPLSLNKYFPPDAEELISGFQKSQSEALSLGITEVHDILGFENLQIYREIVKRKLLKLRVSLYLYLRDLKELKNLEKEDIPENEFIKFKGIKIFSDGSLGARTAALFEDYVDTLGNRGMLLLKKEEIKKWVHECEKRNFQLLVHAIGDLAIHTVIQAFSEVLYNNHLRHRIEHCELPLDSDLEKIKEKGIYLSVQPNFIGEWQARRGMYKKVLGNERWRRLNPIGKMVKLGIPVAFGSDCMPLGPFYGIESIMSHPLPSQSIPFEKAIELYTYTPRIFNFQEKNRGKILKGSDADFILIDEKNEIKAVFIKGESVK